MFPQSAPQCSVVAAQSLLWSKVISACLVNYDGVSGKCLLAYMQFYDQEYPMARSSVVQSFR